MERDLNKENRILKEKVRTLQQENRRLRRLKGLEVDPLIGLLRQRGLQIFRSNPTDDLLLPDASPQVVEYEFYERLHRYSFRLFLRDLIRHKDGAELPDLTRYCSDETARDYLHLLMDAGAVEEVARLRFRVTTPVKSFGGTLEWYVSRLLRDEFAAPALYGVRFKGTKLSGDYDILADFAGTLLYMEVKSSPPRGIELHQITDFLKRIDGILPEGAIFFNDTELRMKDKLVPFFEEALQARAARKGSVMPPTERLVGEIFRFGKSLYLMNSRKSVKENLAFCLKAMLREANNFYE